MRIYMAGYESIYKSYGIELPKKANVFVSYFYRGNLNKAIEEGVISGFEGKVVLDSGAHSFFGAEGMSTGAYVNKKNNDLGEPKEYFEGYIEWLKKNHTYFDYFVELDLQELVGDDVVEGWRDRMRDIGILKKCITVHHSENSYEDWKKLVDRSESGYIGVEGLRVGYRMLPYKKLLKYAYEKGVKVHAFAFTRQSLLHRFPFYSVDSTSWTAPVRYGKLSVFRDGRLVGINECPEEFWQEKLGRTFQSRTKNDEASRQKCMFMVEQYLKMEEYFTNLWRKRGVIWEK